MSQLEKSPQTNRRSIPLIILGLGLILIAVSAYYLLLDTPPQPDLAVIPAKVDYHAPQLALTDLSGNPASLADYRGQVILVNLWTTWCPPCKEEMPAFESFYRRHVDKGFTIVAVNDGEAESDIIKFVEEHGLTFPIWVDPTYIATEQAFKTLNLPSSFVIDRNGQVVLRWVGGVDLRTLEEYVTPIIEEQP